MWNIFFPDYAEKEAKKCIAHTEKPSSLRVTCIKMSGKWEYLTTEFEAELEVVRGAYTKHLWNVYGFQMFTCMGLASHRGIPASAWSLTPSLRLSESDIIKKCFYIFYY